MKNPFFSIIIPTYNRAHFLKIAITSVLRQTFTDWELIVIDDGSTDQTPEVIKQFDDRRLRYLSYAHQGVAAARNAGVKESKGEFICFLDSDDRFRAEKLEITHTCIKSNPSYDIFHTEELWYRQGRLLAQKSHHKKPSGFIFEDAVNICCVSISTAAIRRDIFDSVGSFDTNLPACEDYDFWLRVSAKYPIFLIPQYLTIKEGGHSDQQSHKYPAMDKFRIYALEKILRSKDISDDTYRIAYAALKRKCAIYTNGARKRGNNADVIHYANVVKELERTNA